MAWFFKKNKEVSSRSVDESTHNFLTTSFSHVKNDVMTIVDWLRYFNQKSDEHDLKLQSNELKLAQIEQQLAYVPYIYNQLQVLMNQPDKNELLLQKVRNLHDKVSMMDHDHSPILKRLEEIEASLLASKPQDLMILKINEIASRLEILENKPVIGKKAITVKDKMYQNLTRNSKEYVKKMILSLIVKYQNITGTQLKQMIVDEQGLCSKSTFYRILSDAEKEDFVQVIVLGKEKKYIAKALSAV